MRGRLLEAILKAERDWRSRGCAAATRKVVLMVEAGRKVRGRAASGRRFSGEYGIGRTGSPAPGRFCRTEPTADFGRTNPTADFGRTKPTVGPLGGTMACARAALDRGSRAGHSARRCPALLGQRKSFRRNALGRVVPVSRGCGIWTLRQWYRRACVIAPKLQRRRAALAQS
jgi:hypothetical protein